MWGFSHLEEKNEDLMAAIAVQATVKMADFNAQNVANTVTPCSSSLSQALISLCRHSY